MKLLISLMVLFATFNAFAIDTDASKRALNTLMNKNPYAYSEVLTSQRVNTLIAHMMTSSFVDRKHGVLSVIENDCTRPSDWYYDCTLSLNSSDKKIDGRGSFIADQDSIETTIVINYSVDRFFKIMIGKVKYEIR